MQSAASGDLDARTAADLVLRIGRDRDREAFSRLFNAYGPRIKGFLVRLGLDPSQAEDAMQDVMVLVWRRAETFDPRQASAATWIYRIARNRRIDLYRRSRREVMDANDPGLWLDEPDQADAHLDGLERDAQVRSALEILPLEQRDLILRAYYEDRSQTEIAEATGLALGTVKSRLRLAYAKLRERLADAL